MLAASIIGFVPCYQLQNHRASDSLSTKIIITIDGINSFMLGLHGNTSVETPAFDGLAVSSISFDFAFAPSCDLKVVLDALLTGSQDQPITSAIEGSSTFVSDCSSAIDIAESAQFDSIVPITPNDGNAPAESAAQTQAADFFAAATEAVETLEQGDLLWLHFSGLTRRWDAPLEMRQQYRSLDDPEPYTDVKPPCFTFDADQDDPDLLVSVQQSCFAQIAIVDNMLGVFLDHLNQHDVAQSAVVIVAGLRGYGLGEHGYVGPASNLYAQSLHVPLLVRFPDTDETTKNRRSHCLIQTSAIGDWILNSAGVKDQCEIIMDNDAPPIFSSSKSAAAVQTAAWKFLRWTDDDGAVFEQLFAKPDDRWEVNDVASRCPQIVEELEELLKSKKDMAKP